MWCRRCVGVGASVQLSVWCEVLHCSARPALKVRWGVCGTFVRHPQRGRQVREVLRHASAFVYVTWFVFPYGASCSSFVFEVKFYVLGLPFPSPFGMFAGPFLDVHVSTVVRSEAFCFGKGVSQSKRISHSSAT